MPPSIHQNFASLSLKSIKPFIKIETLCDQPNSSINPTLACHFNPKSTFSLTEPVVVTQVLVAGHL